MDRRRTVVALVCLGEELGLTVPKELPLQVAAGGDDLPHLHADFHRELSEGRDR